LDERLVILNEEGVYRIYDLQGDYRQHSLGSEAAETGVVDARIYDNGLVAMTGSLNLLEVKGWEGGRPLTLASPGEAVVFRNSNMLLFIKQACLSLLVYGLPFLLI
jgi:vacuolar protein sorting-associated protein 16